MIRDEMLKGYDDKHILFGTFFAFHNHLQAAGDAFYNEITAKQFFLLICLSLFHEQPPTLNELSEVMGSSHQNVKQLALKLEKNGLVILCTDDRDRRKVRILPTEQLSRLQEKYYSKELEFMEKLFAGVNDDEIATTMRAIRKIEENLIKIREESE